MKKLKWAYPGGSGRAQSSSLLSQKGHGGALIQQAELAVLVLPITGVSVDSSVEQRPVEVPNK